MNGAKRRKRLIKSIRQYLIASMILFVTAQVIQFSIIDKTISKTTTVVAVAVRPNIIGNPIKLPEKSEPPAFIEIPVCNSSASKTYMDESLISRKSIQGKFIDANMTIRDGLLYDSDNFIGVALGSYFGAIGNRFIITLDTGIELKVVKIEAKSDAHTENGCIQRWDRSVIEFVIDRDTTNIPIAPNGYRASGNFNNLPQFKGKIIKIMKER